MHFKTGRRKNENVNFIHHLNSGVTGCASVKYSMQNERDQLRTL